MREKISKKPSLINLALLLKISLLASMPAFLNAATATKTESNATPKVESKPLIDFSNPLIAQEVAKQCNAIFDARKNEINQDLISLQEQQNQFQSVTSESTKLLQAKEQKLKKQEEVLQKMYEDMKSEQKQKQESADAKLKQINELIAKNDDILKKIKDEKNDKLSQSYAKMKDSKAAPIIAAMPSEDAVDILLSLKPAEMGKILSKMQPDAAAKLTELIKIYPKKPTPPATPPKAPTDEGIINTTPPNTLTNLKQDKPDSLTKEVSGGYRVY